MVANYVHSIGQTVTTQYSLTRAESILWRTEWVATWKPCECKPWQTIFTKQCQLWEAALKPNHAPVQWWTNLYGTYRCARQCLKGYHGKIRATCPNVILRAEYSCQNRFENLSIEACYNTKVDWLAEKISSALANKQPLLISEKDHGLS